MELKSTVYGKNNASVSPSSSPPASILHFGFISQPRRPFPPLIYFLCTPYLDHTTLAGHDLHPAVHDFFKPPRRLHVGYLLERRFTTKLYENREWS